MANPHSNTYAIFGRHSNGIQRRTYREVSHCETKERSVGVQLAQRLPARGHHQDLIVGEWALYQKETPATFSCCIVS